MTSKDGRIRRQRVKRRLPFHVLDKLGNGLLVVAVVAVPAVTAINLAGEVDRRDGAASDATPAAAADSAALSGDDVDRLLDKANKAGRHPETADSGEAVGARTRERALTVLGNLPKERREALYERFGHQLEARGIDPAQIEERLADE